MKRFLLFGILTFVCAPLVAQKQPTRPKITGIDHVRIYVTDIDRSRDFYSKLFGVRSGGGVCFDRSGRCYTVGWVRDQTIRLEKNSTSSGKNWVAEVTFTTDDVEGMHRYLVAHGLTVGKILRDSSALDRKNPYAAHFDLRDPEGTQISFIQRYGYPIDDPGFNVHADSIGTRILHAGFVVKDLAAENRFYIDLLGFRLYWHGGFKDDGEDWYELQVPDGSDWIEYMLNIPADADHKELGIQNHFSLGVKDIHATAEQLRKNGLQNFDGPEIGRDGKWSLDAYDPDGTRVEFMEFTPAQNPCCHPYTAAHPKP